MRVNNFYIKGYELIHLMYHTKEIVRNEFFKNAIKKLEANQI